MESQPKTKHSTALAKTLNHRTFDPIKFANSISKESDGDKDLHETRHRVHLLGEETAQVLKKQVYQNYQLFINTAKEISFLEGEMFQLSNILTEQKNLMENMTKTFAAKEQLSDDIGHEKRNQQILLNKETEKKQVMESLLTKVEGCEKVVKVAGRSLVFDGDVLELDMDTFEVLEKVHLFIFNDCVMLATSVNSRRGKTTSERYKFQTVWEIDTLAMVNARDIGRVKNAFKMLVFANARMFQCETAKEKREWIEIMDSTKRRHLSKEDREEDPPTSPSIKTFEVQTSPKISKIDEINANMIDEEVRHFLNVFSNMTEDLDVFIAQRSFEEAVDSTLEMKQLISEIRDPISSKDTTEKLELRINQLVKVLLGELKTTPDRSLRRGAAVLRRPVGLLIRLDQVSKACQLFLKNRSGALEFSIQQLRTEGSLTLFINKLCKIFFSFLKETANEFKISFDEIDGCFSAFTVWMETEMIKFVDRLAVQVFTGSSEISDVAECVLSARKYCSKLASCGLQLDFLLNNLLLRHISSSLRDHRQKIIDATNLRNSEENWRPLNLGDPQAVEKLCAEMKKLGIQNFQDFCYESCFIHLTSSTIALTRALLLHVDVCLKMAVPENENDIIEGIVEIISSYTQFIDGCLHSEKNRQNKFQLIKQNARFLAISLIPLIEQKLKKEIVQPLNKLVKLRTTFLQKICK